MPLFLMAKSRFLAVAFLCALLSAFPAVAACTNPDGAVGEIIYNGNYSVFQGCTLRGWQGFHALEDYQSLPPKGCDEIGQTCTGADDGIIYAGEYLGHKMYVTAADAPAGGYRWNNGESSERPDLDNAWMPNCPDGLVRNDNRYSDQSSSACIGAQRRAFTEYLANFTGLGAPYNGASYCYHLGKATDPMGPDNPHAHGRSDWYLPAVDELEFIYDNLGPQPKHGFQDADYWSSTEVNDLYAWTQYLNDGHQYDGDKSIGRRVRCVRR